MTSDAVDFFLLSDIDLKVKIKVYGNIPLCLDMFNCSTSETRTVLRLKASDLEKSFTRSSMILFDIPVVNFVINDAGTRQFELTTPFFF
jgi:hypothetical protein